MGKKKKRRIPIKTGRVVHHFWLNIWNGPEGKLDNEVQELKKQRKFAETVRDGLRLILDLRAGSLTVLFELFPHLQERLTGQVITSTPQPPPNTAELDKKIAHLEELVLILSKTTYEMQPAPQSAQPPTTGKSLSNMQFALPVFEDDDEETQEAIVMRKSTIDPAANLLRSAMATQ